MMSGMPARPGPNGGLNPSVDERRGEPEQLYPRLDADEYQRVAQADRDRADADLDPT
jgi:hypothetical protein